MKEKFISEFIYIDERRLNSYVEQINPSSMKYEKIPEWTADLSLISPKITSSRKTYPRNLTTYEKLEILIDFLDKNNFVNKDVTDLIYSFSNDYTVDYVPFAWHKITATRLIIQPENESSPCIYIWVYSNYNKDSEKRINICLMEDFIHDDISLPRIPISVYSSLIGMLINQYDIFKQTTILNNEEFSAIKKLNNYHEYSKKYSVLMSKFIGQNVIDVLVNAGAKIISPNRDIEVLYRFRECQCLNSGTQIFGYPLVIKV
ncbi:hypothetical protein FNO01nite_29520 [Flavobacterium noncentrifugens]|uniref:Uncharacterized protein n=1 Tax=Flavobacterium noncentrifugens TaxID=1128970 RepID=A0A1G8Y1X3_9FLAO|nr:hypothetical protein [Flavobacterium noncentrifugens]GEP52280.1 hypothetical protein FNO01nite_29520 [Flavobacterium noncentrifugens]SDJ96859.1 hypothetical protein SAMN04487935_2161 [Flavobacterium noncentrifugens]